jgi:hypothetical protein
VQKRECHHYDSHDKKNDPGFLQLQAMHQSYEHTLHHFRSSLLKISGVMSRAHILMKSTTKDSRPQVSGLTSNAGILSEWVVLGMGLKSADAGEGVEVN